VSGTAAKAQANGTEPNADTAVGGKSLAEAFLAAQAEMPPVEPDKENPHFKSKFVSLGHLLSKVRPVLHKHGLALVQAPDLEEGKFVLRTTILHSSGEEMSFAAPLSPAKDDPQGQGSAITYMRRYAAGAALAIADQEDDDGNAAGSNGGGTTAAPAEPIVRLNPERTERILGGLKALKLAYGPINLMFGACGIDGLSTNTPEALQERIAGLGEVEADKLEVELEKAAQDQAAEGGDSNAE